jgi:HSP20 family protein
MIIRRIGRPMGEYRSPFEELELMRRQMERLMEDLGGTSATRPFLREPWARVFPLINLTEDKNNYYLRAELPGIKADDLEMTVTGNTLTLSGERKIPAEEENAKYHRRERDAGTFNRVVTLPDQIDSDKVDAHSADGILTVVLPKSEAAKPKQITVKGS